MQLSWLSSLLPEFISKRSLIVFFLYDIDDVQYYSINIVLFQVVFIKNADNMPDI